MSAHRLSLLAAAALAVTLAAASAQHAPTPPDNRQRDSAGAQDAPAEPMPSYAEPLQFPGEAGGPTTVGPPREEKSATGEQSASRSPPAGTPTGASTTGAAGAGSGARLRPQERAVIRDVVRRSDVIARAPDCRFGERVDFAVGRPFPRTTRICRFPNEVQAKVPASRQYRYLITSNEIVIIDPNDHHIIEVIE